ncbi:MAG: hypothetical protein JO032_12305 [Alphaproteobacteria bacterium]|nr:hypothetical protein [Alphaproteobacteria bacterium]
MRGDDLIDGEPTLKPGQIWLIEHAAASGPPLDRSAFAGADVVLYDRALTAPIHDVLPPGMYAEPLPSACDDGAAAISARALKLASEGWRVIQLVPPKRAWRQRLREAGAELVPPARAQTPAMLLITKVAAGRCRSREIPASELPELVDTASDGELLILIIGPFAEAAASAGYAYTGNGLAG